MQPAKAPSRTFTQRFTARLNHHLNQALQDGLQPDPSATPWAAFHTAVFDQFKPEGQYQELLAESAAEECWRRSRYGTSTTWLSISSNSRCASSNVYRNQRERRADPDMDGADRHAAAALTACAVDLALEFPNLMALLRQQVFVYRDLWKWLNQPDSPPVDLEETQLSSAWQA